MRAKTYPRFHVSSGPEPLFERVRHVFREPRTIKLHGAHFQQRTSERAAPVELMEAFDARLWELRTVEVRADSGKFVRTAWRRRLEGDWWWLVLGYDDAAQTVYPSDKTGDGPGIVREGALFERVEAVNRGLMRAAGFEHSVAESC